MPHSSYDEPRNDRGPSAAAGLAEVQQQVVLIAGRSPVNLVVLSRIAERARMRPVAESPERAAAMIEALRPSVIILDGGADLQECQAMSGPIASYRRVAFRAPFTILLTPHNRPSPDLLEGGVIDAFVAKPVTPDRLQPMLEQVRDEAARSA